MSTAAVKPSARTKILGSALAVIRAKGYAATSVDDLCAAAGVTKGAFFHHFKSKEDLAVAAADFWSETTSALFASAPYHAHGSALQRVLAYIDFRKIILIGGVPEFTCLAGTMVQETYETNPAIRDACARAIFDHAERIETDIAAAIAERGIDPPWTAASLALYTQAVLQGAFILAKARGGAQVAADTIDHLRRYVELLFDQPKQKEDAA
jgi:TetR/AcrR family transcriptional repressor of nem operon